MSWRFNFCIGVTTAICLGGAPAFADSPEPIDLPDPKRMVVNARAVETGELIIYDPVAIRFASSRPMPDAIALPRQRRIAIAARMDSIYIALPVRMRAIVSARMDGVDIAVPDLLALSTSAQMDNIDITLPDPLAVSVALRIFAAELKMPVTRRLYADTMRHEPEGILITEPLAMTALIRRQELLDAVRHRE